MEVRLAKLARQIVGMMKKRGREIIRALRRIAVLAVEQVLPQDRNVGGIFDQSARQAVDQRGKARIGRGEDDATALDSAWPLAQRTEPLAGVGQAMQRGEKQDGIGAGLGEFQPTGVTKRRGCERGTGAGAAGSD